MKTLRIKSGIAIIASLILIAVLFPRNRKPAPAVLKSAVVDSVLLPEPEPRYSITFILGKDESRHNPYYTLADHYYRLNEQEKTDVVVNSIFNLYDVHKYLASHRPKDGQPWGLVNLVVHGNEFNDLGVLVSKTGTRASEQSLLKAIRKKMFVPLDSLTVDNNTVIDVHGCAVGNNVGLLNAIALVFTGSRHRPEVKASRMFEYYAFLFGDENPAYIRHYYAKAWYAYYKTDSVAGVETLTRQLRSRYPYERVDWREALYRQFPSNPSQAYHFNLSIPVSWEDFYDEKNQLPDLNSKVKQSKYLKQKKEFHALLGQTKIPAEYFEPKFYQLVYKGKGKTKYSSKIKARAEVVCIVQPLVADTSDHEVHLPYVPAANDSLFFAFARN